MREGLLYRMELKGRSDLHLERKIWHMTGVFAIYIAYRLMPSTVFLSILLSAWVVFVPFDFFRLRYPPANEIAMRFFKIIMRKSEVDRLAGTTYLLSGVLIVHLIFSREIVSLTLLFLAFADPIASFFGVLYGKNKIFGHKSWQGFGAAFLVCTLLTALFVSFTMQSVASLILVSIIGGLIGACAELIPIGKTDDNLTLPLLSAVGLSLLFHFFGI